MIIPTGICGFCCLFLSKGLRSTGVLGFLTVGYGRVEFWSVWWFWYSYYYSYCEMWGWCELGDIGKTDPWGSDSTGVANSEQSFYANKMWFRLRTGRFTESTKDGANWRIGYIGSGNNVSMVFVVCFTCNIKTDSPQWATGLANRVVCTARMGVIDHALRSACGFHCYVLSLCESTE